MPLAFIDPCLYDFFAARGHGHHNARRRDLQLSIVEKVGRRCHRVSFFTAYVHRLINDNSEAALTVTRMLAKLVPKHLCMGPRLLPGQLTHIRVDSEGLVPSVASARVGVSRRP